MDINFNSNKIENIQTKDLLPDNPKLLQNSESENPDKLTGSNLNELIGRSEVLISARDKKYSEEEKIKIQEEYLTTMQSISKNELNYQVKKNLLNYCPSLSAQKCITEIAKKQKEEGSLGENIQLIPVVRQISNIYSKHPAFVEEITQKGFPILNIQNNMDKLYPFFNGSDDNRYNKLTEEQKDFAIDLAKGLKGEPAELFFKSPERLNKNLTDINPEYYGIIKAFGNTCNDNYDFVELTENIIEDQDFDKECLDKLVNILSSKENISKRLKDCYYKVATNIDIADDAIDSGIRFRSFKELKKDYPDVADKTVSNLKSFRETDLGKDLGVMDLKNENFDDRHIRLVCEETSATLKFDKKTGELASFIDKNKINHNLKTKTTVETNVYKTDAKKEIRQTVKTSDNKTEILKKRSDIKGEYSIYHITPDGKEKLIGLAEIDKKGNRYIEKHLTSLNGTVSDYVYSDDKKGNKFLYYKITNKDGIVLYENRKDFRVIDKNHFISQNNDDKYDIKYTKDKIVVTNLNKKNKKVVYKIKDLENDPKVGLTDSYYDIIQKESKEKGMTKDEYEDSIIDNNKELYRIFDEAIKNYAGNRTVDRKLLPLLKQLSGEEWFALDKANTHLIALSDSEDGDSSSIDTAIIINKIHNNSITALEHEIGHQKYRAFDYENDEELKKIYEEEKILFLETFPDFDVKKIKYFLRGIKQNKNRGIDEFCAETNLITNTFQGLEQLEDRTNEIQTYMPETLAYVANKNKNIS